MARRECNARTDADVRLQAEKAAFEGQVSAIRDDSFNSISLLWFTNER